jgi:Uma2 family endonuclease
MNTIPVLHPDDVQEDRPMPSLNHAIVCQNAGAQLYRFRDKVVTCQQLNLNLDGWQSIPDVCAYPREALPHDWLADEDECKIAPWLVIEVVSPKQNLQPLLDKAREYLLHGVKTCWIIIPPARTVVVLPQSGPSKSFNEGVVGEESLGVTMDVSELFV